MVSDLLCNGGGVTVSWFEMVQNAYGYREEEGVHQRLEKKKYALKDKAFAITLSSRSNPAPSLPEWGQRA